MNSEDIRNDYCFFYHQSQVPNQMVSFVLNNINTGEELDLIDNTCSQFFDFRNFENNLNLINYKIKCKKVLQLKATGSDKITKNGQLLRYR